MLLLTSFFIKRRGNYSKKFFLSLSIFMLFSPPHALHHHNHHHHHHHQPSIQHSSPEGKFYYNLVTAHTKKKRLKQSIVAGLTVIISIADNMFLCMSINFWMWSMFEPSSNSKVFSRIMTHKPIRNYDSRAWTIKLKHGITLMSFISRQRFRPFSSQAWGW